MQARHGEIEAVEQFLKKANADWVIIEKLVTSRKLKMIEYENHQYYMRRLVSRMKNIPRK